MTQEERDIELIRQVIDTKRYDGIEYFHTYKGIKYYRFFMKIAQGCHTGMPHLVYIKNNKVVFVEDSLEKRRIKGDKLTHTH
ncbi:MAG: hypothetical protein IKA19_09660 [Muribaculaceae bacterium]|nr:hypothetical protein [Muribaculaceae bacterium]